MNDQVGADGPSLLAAETLAAELWTAATAHQGPFERARAARIGRMLTSPGGLDLVLALTDEVLRIRPPDRAAAVLAELVGDQSQAGALGRWDATALRAGGRLGPRLPRLVVPAARQRVRAEMAGVILPASRWRLARHAGHRRRQSIRLNVNVLGEAILGDDEAEQRLQRVLDVLAQPAVDYVSVKISSIAPSSTCCASIGRSSASPPRSGACTTPPPLPPAQVRQPGHGGVPGSGADAGGVPAGARRGRLRRPPGGDRAAGLPARFAARPGGTVPLGSPASSSGRRLGEDSFGKRGQSRHGTGRCRTSRLARGPLRSKDEMDANYKRMLDVLLDPQRRRRAPRRRQPQRVRAGLGRHPGRGGARPATGSTSKCSRAWPRPWPRRPPVDLAACSCTPPSSPAARSSPPSPTWCAGSTKTAAPTTFSPTPFSLQLDSPTWAAEADRFRRAVALRTARPCPPADPGPGHHPGRAAVGPDSPTSPIPTSPLPPTASGSADTSSRPPSRPARLPAGGGWPDRGRCATDVGVDPSTGGKWPTGGGPPTGTGGRGGRGRPDGGRRVVGDPPADRRRVLEAAAEALARRRGELLAVMAVDAGKTVREGDPEVSEAIDFATYYAAHIPAAGAGFRPLRHGGRWPRRGTSRLSIPAGGVLGRPGRRQRRHLEARAGDGRHRRRAGRGALGGRGVPDALQFVPCVDGEASRRLITHPGWTRWC